MNNITKDAKLLLIAIPILLWTLIPIYHLFILSISPEKDMFDGVLWPNKPTLQNFQIVFGQKHYYLKDFWLQLGNSFLIAIATGLGTLLVATFAAFAISRLKIKGGRGVMNAALATYLIPAAFLASVRASVIARCRGEETHAGVARGIGDAAAGMRGTSERCCRHCPRSAMNPPKGQAWGLRCRVKIVGVGFVLPLWL